MPRSKSKKHSVRLTVTLDEGEYTELTRLGVELDLSAEWKCRRTEVEFVVRHQEGVAADLLPRRPELEQSEEKKAGGSSGKRVWPHGDILSKEDLGA